MPLQPSTRRRLVAQAAAVALGAALASCGERKAELPPDPPGVESVKGVAFSETVLAADRQAQKDLVDQLASRFGRDLPILPRSIDSDAEPGPIRAHYERALVGGLGWKEFPLAESGSVWSFAFISPDNRFVFALIALNPRFAPEGGGRVPLTIITNLPGAR